MFARYKNFYPILLLGLFLVPATAYAAAPKILVKPSLANVIAARSDDASGRISNTPVRVNSGILIKNRRFRLITSAGRSMFGRKLKAIGKRDSFQTSAGRATVVTYTGQIRRPGEGNFGNFHLTVLARGHGKATLAGTFNSPPFSQNIHQRQGGVLEMESFFTGKMPACGGEPDMIHQEHDQPSGGNTGAGTPPAAGDSSSVTIDVAFLIPTEMITAYGSLDAAVVEASNAITSANTVYNNSEISQQLRLVYAGQTATLQNSDMAVDLNRLTDPSDGAFDEAQTVRDTYGADVVTLLRHESSPSYCGIGWLMQSGFVGAGFSEYAYNVVIDFCASGNYSFAHELGHNMGAAHDFANAGGSGAYNYSYGYQFTGTNNGHYRTVMAYASGAAGEVRIPYFSNPDITYQGTAAGTVNANNALTLNNTASVVAAFRDTVVGATPTATPTAGPGETPSPTPTDIATPQPTAVPTPAIEKISFKSLTVGAVKKKCAINGAVARKNGSAAKSLVVELKQTSGAVLKTSVTNSSGKFSFKTTRNKKYLLVVSSSLSRSVRCR